MVENAAKLTPSEVKLSWDPGAKRYDQFLSHKISDAKDVVLTWYNALSALGHEPFLDRLSLDAVDKIPTYIQQSVTVVVAVTANLWQSYWCAVELCTAVHHHADGTLNILLVPVQGECWIGVDGESQGDNAGKKMTFPTPGIMMQNFDKWFPAGSEHCSETTRALVARLYGGGEYTQSRLVCHTLMHYKSFERLLVARLGVSIASKKRSEQLVAAGCSSVAEQYEAMVPIICEANAMQRLAFGVNAMTFSVDIVYERGAMGCAYCQLPPLWADSVAPLIESCAATTHRACDPLELAIKLARPPAKLTIFEHRVGGGEQADPSKQPVDFARFADHLMWLRGHTVSKRYHNASVLVEQLLVADVADISSAIDGGNAGGDVWEAVSEALAEASDQMQESVK
eukprot:4930999-Prymnesium_polylepis.2